MLSHTIHISISLASCLARSEGRLDSKMPSTRSQSSRFAKVILVLPFTRATLNDPAPLLPIITRVFTEASPSDFVVLFSSPGSTQLYPHIRKHALSNWNPFQTFLAKVYACLAAAQWSTGNVLSHVEVAFLGEGEGSLGGYEDARVIGPRGGSTLERIC